MDLKPYTYIDSGLPEEKLLSDKVQEKHDHNLEIVRNISSERQCRCKA